MNEYFTALLISATTIALTQSVKAMAKSSLRKRQSKAQRPKEERKW